MIKSPFSKLKMKRIFSQFEQAITLAIAFDQKKNH